MVVIKQLKLIKCWIKSKNGGKSISKCIFAMQCNGLKRTSPLIYNNFFSYVELNSHICVSKVTDFVPAT